MELALSLGECIFAFRNAEELAGFLNVLFSFSLNERDLYARIANESVECVLAETADGVDRANHEVMDAFGTAVSFMHREYGGIYDPQNTIMEVQGA
jgi:hypothetical protein